MFSKNSDMTNFKFIYNPQIIETIFLIGIAGLGTFTPMDINKASP
jgi:hypothetical protein